MANMIDYLKWRGDITFEKGDCNRIDILIFTQIAMLDLDKLIPPYLSSEEVLLDEVCEKYFGPESDKNDTLGLIIPHTIFEMFKLASTTNRFSKLLLSNYVNIIDENGEEQFSALTIKIKENFRVISFSGTDDTIIGWKENFNMMFKSPIPAQLTAIKYIEDILNLYPNDSFILCGHSKGGNMALYGGTHIDDLYQDRIISIYNFDGPGVSRAITTEEKYLKNLNKVTTIIPQSSTIGRLFEHNEVCEIIKSTEVALYQHDAFSWEVLGADFIIEPVLTKESNHLDEKIKEVLDELTDEEKQKFVEITYNLLTETTAKNLIDLKTRKKELMKAYFNLTKEERKFIVNPLKKLFADRTVLLFVINTLRESRNVNKTNKED